MHCTYDHLIVYNLLRLYATVSDSARYPQGPRVRVRNRDSESLSQLGGGAIAKILGLWYG